MGEVLAFTEEHIQEVADLYLKSMRGQQRTAPRSLVDYFRDILLANPWVTPDIPSLMYMEKGRLVGFMGIIPRPMEFENRAIRVAVGAQFFVDRKDYRGPAAVEILRHLFRGPQEFTFTDGSGEDSSVVWNAAGGRIARIYSFNWMRILRPFRACGGMFDRLGGAALKGASGLITGPLDFLLSKAPVGMLKPPVSPYSTKLVSADELFEALGQISMRGQLKPAYRLQEFRWLMEQAVHVTGLGTLRMMTVNAPDGSLCGTLVYYAKPAGSAYVLQIGWRRRDFFPGILTALFQDAWQQGQYAVKGQAIPQFLPNMSEQYCMFRQLNSCVVGYSRDPAIMSAFQLGETALTRLDGECWLRFPLEEWRS